MKLAEGVEKIHPYFTGSKRGVRIDHYIIINICLAYIIGRISDNKLDIVAAAHPHRVVRQPHFRHIRTGREQFLNPCENRVIHRIDNKIGLYLQLPYSRIGGHFDNSCPSMYVVTLQCYAVDPGEIQQAFAETGAVQFVILQNQPVTVGHIEQAGMSHQGHSGGKKPADLVSRKYGQAAVGHIECQSAVIAEPASFHCGILRIFGRYRISGYRLAVGS